MVVVITPVNNKAIIFAQLVTEKDPLGKLVTEMLEKNVVEKGADCCVIEE